MKAIIPTGGRGTRMQPLTFSTNKHFVPVAGKPLIFYPIETVAETGIKNVLITYNPGWLEAVKAILGDGSKWGLKFRYVLQPKPKGLANIIEVCEKALAGEPFFLHLGDNIFVDGIKSYVEYFDSHDIDALVTMMKVAKGENSRMGVPYFNSRGNFKEYVEKPQNPPNNFGIPGLYFFNKHVFQAFRGKDKIMPSGRGELEIGSLYNWLARHGYKVEAMEYKGKWLDPGKFTDWMEANRILLKGLKTSVESKIDKKTTVDGKIKIGKKCRIQKSEIQGPVIIGDNVQIINSRIGPFSAISDNCEIRDSRVENSILMEGVKILKVREPIENSLVGTGTEIVNGKSRFNRLELFVGEKSVISL